jgi:hypothetical protein
MSLQGQSRHFEDLNETRRQLGGHPSSTTSRLNLMRLRDVLAPDPRFAVRRGRIFAPSRRYRVELSRPRPDFIDILAPTDASSADVDWIKAELSRTDRYPSSFKIANTSSSRATLG